MIIYPIIALIVFLLLVRYESEIRFYFNKNDIETLDSETIITVAAFAAFIWPLTFLLIIYLNILKLIGGLDGFVKFIKKGKEE